MRFPWKKNHKADDGFSFSLMESEEGKKQQQTRYVCETLPAVWNTEK